MEAAVGQRSTELFVKEEEKQGNLDSLLSQSVDVPLAVALEQSVSLELAQVVAKLIETVLLFREMKRCQDGGMDLPGGPAGDPRSGVQGSTINPAKNNASRKRFVMFMELLSSFRFSHRRANPFRRRHTGPPSTVVIGSAHHPKRAASTHSRLDVLSVNSNRG